VPAQLADILRVARPRNLSLGVTGALLAHRGYFAQVLEGARGNGDVLMDYIGRDPRHEAIRIVRAEERRDRMFANWSMAQVVPSAALDAFLADDGEGVGMDPDGFVAALRQSTGAQLHL